MSDNPTSPGPPGGPPPGPQYPVAAPPPAPTGRTNATLLIVVAVVVVVGIGAAVTAIVLTSKNDESAGGEVFLEPATAPGENPFTTEIPTATVPPTTAAPGTTTAPSTTTTAPGGATAIGSISGGKPGLYGGTQNSASCDPEQMIVFLERNPDKARAWVDALNTDITLQWSGGTKVQVNQIRAYISELTPVFLTSDTRVTNYGYSNGRPTPRQAVLQAGTAVLVDTYGVPRAKCACGNPLTRPIAVKHDVAYVGPRWPGWSPTTVVVVQQTTVTINNFVLVDFDTGGYFERPAGTTGLEDHPVDASSIPSTTTTTGSGRSGTTTTGPERTTTTQKGKPSQDYCQLWSDAARKWEDSDVEETGQYDELLADLKKLTDEAPPEIAPAMRTIFEWSEAGARSRNLDFSNVPPEVDHALNAVLEFLESACAFDTNN